MITGREISGIRAAHLVVVQTQHRQAVERQVVQEFQERRPQAVEIAAVGAQVVGVDVGYHRHHRLQIQKRGIAFVGFRHQVAALAQTCVGAGAVQTAADDEGRIQSALGQQAGHQAGGGGLAVGAGHRDAVAEAHQFRQHFRPRHHRDPRSSRAASTSGLSARTAVDTTTTSTPLIWAAEWPR